LRQNGQLERLVKNGIDSVVSDASHGALADAFTADVTRLRKRTAATDGVRHQKQTRRHQNKRPR
jgi:hypothetical protein